jgi:hypothetical protein
VHVWSRSSGQQRLVFAPAADAPEAHDAPDAAASLINAPLPWYSSPDRDQQAGHRQQQPAPPPAAFHGRGWQSMGGLLTGRQIAQAAAGQPLPAAVVALGSAGGAGTAVGYTCVAGCAPAGRPSELLAGTADSRLCRLDAHAGVVVSELATTLRRGADPAASAVSACCVAPGGGWQAGCNGAGQLVVLDARCGVLQHCWRAHEAGATWLQPLDAHQLLTSSLDRSVRLWDLRMAPSASSAAAAGARAAGGVSQRGLVRSFVHREGVEGFAVHSGCLVSRCGGSIGVAALSGQEAVVRVAPSSIRTSRGAKEAGAITGLALLPLSKLMVVGGEDGQVKVCR